MIQTGQQWWQQRQRYGNLTHPYLDLGTQTTKLCIQKILLLCYGVIYSSTILLSDSFWLLYKTRGLKDFATCAYEAEMGTNLATSKLILKNLKSSQWLDTNTDSVFFEQTYYNGNINSFLMFRISWEHVDGGMFQGKAITV